MLTSVLLKYPKFLGATVACLVIASAAAIPRIEFSSLHTFFDYGHPEKKKLDVIAQRFVNDDILVIAHESADALSRESLELDRELTETLAALELDTPSGRRVRAAADVISLTSVKDAFGGEASYQMRVLVPESLPTDRGSLEEIRRRGHANPVIAQNLISKDDRVSSLIFRLNPELESDRFVEVVGLVRGVLAQAEARTGHRLHVSGYSVTEADFQTYARSDLLRLLPVIVVLCLALGYLFTRSAWAVFAMLTIIASAQFVALGFIPILGYRYNPLANMQSASCVILCTSTCFHFFGELANCVSDKRGHPVDLRLHIFREVLWPSFLCSLFTAIGFASLSFSEVQAIREFGILSTLMTATSFFITVAGIAVHWHIKEPEAFVSEGGLATSRRFQEVLGALSRGLLRRPGVALLLSVVVVAGVSVGMAFLRRNENSHTYYPEDSPLRRADRVIESNLAGSETYVVTLAHPDEEHFLDPVRLAKVEAFSRFLRREGGADVTIDIVDYLKVMHRAFFAEDPKAFRLPESSAAVAQLLALNQDVRVREHLDLGARAVRIFVRSSVHDTDAFQQIIARVESELAAQFPTSAGYQTAMAGLYRLFTITAERTARTQVESLALSGVLIIGLIMLVYRGVSVGLVSLFPNAVPLLVVLGVLGWFDMPITVGNAMVCAIAFGVAVEDTIHFIEEYRAQLARGSGIEAAILETMQNKAPQGILTSVSLGVGFTVIGLAEFIPVREFGLLLGIAVGSAMVANYVALPASLVVFKVRFGHRGDEAEASGLMDVRPGTAKSSGRGTVRV